MRRREHSDLREVMSTNHRTATNWFNNGSVIEDRPVSRQMLFINRICGNKRSDNRLKRFSHLVRHNIFAAEVKVGVSYSANHEGGFRSSKSFP